MKTLQEIDYTSLETGKNIWGRAIREVYRLPPLAAFLILGLSALSLAILTGTIAVIFILSIVFMFPIFYRVGKIQDQIVRTFAASNDWAVLPSKDVTQDKIPPSLIDIGHSKTCSDMIQMQFDNHQCNVFTYSYTTGSGKNSTTHNYTIAQMKLVRPFPHLILDSKKAYGQLKKGQADRKIELEGDFPKYFSLYYAGNEQIEALSVITPDVMQTLIQSNQSQDIEIYADNLYFISRIDIRDRKKLPLLLASVDALADKIVHRAKTMQYSLPEHTSVASAQASTSLLSERNRGDLRKKILLILFGLILGLVMNFISA